MNIKIITRVIPILTLLILSSCSNGKSTCTVRPGVEVDKIPEDLSKINESVVPKGEVTCSF
jgi:hypothetical protein